MNQEQLDSSVARATGESVRTIRSLGFSIADLPLPDHDPDGDADGNELSLDWPYLDWDRVQADRSVRLVIA